jgi:TRAP-type C4-dicarboxylate transport system substrate-binding protein
MTGNRRSGNLTRMNRTVLMLGAPTVLAAAMIGLAACQGMASLDKAGAVRQSVTVIRLQMPDDDQGYGSYFARAAARLSHGTLKVVVDIASYPSALPANEARLVAALRAGRVGFSFQPARDWAAAGLPGFEALDAPFFVTTVRASDLLAASPVAGALLHELSSLGLVGLGLVPSEPRQILSIRPLLAPGAFRGTRIRITDNPETAALMTAIGARPVQGLSANQVGGLLRPGSLTAVEGGPYYMLGNSYNVEAPYLTSYAWIPKFDTLVATQRAWLALTTAQRAAVRQAITDTLAHARAALARNEGQDLATLCTNGVVLDEPSRAQLAALAREAGGPPTGAAVAAMTRMIRADVPGTGPQLSPIPVPTRCRTAQTLAQALALHHLSVPIGSSKHGATIPPGTYVTTDTVADFRKGGAYGRDWSKPTTFTLRLYPNKTLTFAQRPAYPDTPVARGRYVMKGDEVTFIWDAYLQAAPVTMRWSYFDGQLTFTIVNVQDAGFRIISTAHPWRKVG